MGKILKGKEIEKGIDILQGSAARYLRVVGGSMESAMKQLEELRARKLVYRWNQSIPKMPETLE